MYIKSRTQNIRTKLQLINYFAKKKKEQKITVNKCVRLLC